jgi:hypothetical protein
MSRFFMPGTVADGPRRHEAPQGYGSNTSNAAPASGVTLRVAADLPATPVRLYVTVPLRG